MHIADKVFVVTGGGNGIGREVVLGLIAGGARVAAVDLSDTGLAETVRLAATAPGRLTTHVLNITDRTAVQHLPGEVVALHGQIDGLVNVAGIAQRFALVKDLSFEEIERVIAVNFWGVVNTTKAFLPHLLQRPEAGLVNVSSMGGLVPAPGYSAYSASKAAIKLLTEALYAELRGTPVAVTIVFPGRVDTNILSNSGADMPALKAKLKANSMTAKQTSPAEAGKQIIEAVEKGSYRVCIGADARLLDRLSRLMPQRATTLIADRMKPLLNS